MRISFVTFLAATTLFFSQPALASKCVGASPCEACKNCHYCKRCAVQGLTCGMCKGGKAASAGADATVHMVATPRVAYIVAAK